MPITKRCNDQSHQSSKRAFDCPQNCAATRKMAPPRQPAQDQSKIVKHQNLTEPKQERATMPSKMARSRSSGRVTSDYQFFMLCITYASTKFQIHPFDSIFVSLFCYLSSLREFRRPVADDLTGLVLARLWWFLGGLHARPGRSADQ